MVYTIVVHLYAKADETSISKLKAKLAEASEVYSKDKETLSWFVMQDIKDPRAFTIVERYEKESVSAVDFSFHVMGRRKEVERGVGERFTFFSRAGMSFVKLSLAGGGGCRPDVDAKNGIADLVVCRAKSTISTTRTGRRLIRM
jgi:quinol monooxygenase YgiN